MPSPHDAPVASSSPLSAAPRLAAVRAAGLVGAPVEASLARLARTAAALLGGQAAYVTVLDDVRQCVVADAAAAPGGDGTTPSAAGAEIPIAWSFCRHAVERGTPLAVTDATAHPLLRDLPAVTGGGLRAYLGVPVRAGGEVIGTLCVTADAPRCWQDSDIARLEDLASVAEDIIAHRRDAAERRRSEARLASKRQVLEKLAGGAPLGEVLDAIAREVEALAPGTACSILLLTPDGRRLRDGAAPSLSADYRAALDGLAVGAGICSCGEAAALDEPVIVTDLATDPRWAAHRALALAEGLRACWSTPVHAARGGVLGTFAIYHRAPRGPTPEERQLLVDLAHIAGLALEHARAREGERRLAAILEATPDYVAIADTEGRPLWVNAAGRRMGRDVLDEPASIAAPHPAWAAERVLREAIPHALAHGSWHGESALLDRAGHERPVSQLVLAHRGEDGTVEYLSTVMRDLSDRVAAERAVRESEARLEFALAAAAMGTWDWDAQRDLVTCSDGVGPLFGLPPGASHASHDAFLAAIHPEDRWPVAQATAAALADCAPYAVEFRVALPDGSTRWVAQHGRVFRDADGHPVRMAGVVRDINDARVAELRRAEAEAALRAGEHRFRALVERTSELIALVDATGVVSYASPAYGRVLGCPVETLLGQPVFARVHADDLPTAHEAFAAVLATAGATRALRGRYRHEDGSWRTFDVVAENRLEDAAIARIVINARDVTDQQQLEAQLRQAQKMEAVGQLAGGIAHDFNNMLTVVTAHARFVRDELAAGSPAHGDLDQLEEALRRASALTGQLLVFSRRQPVTVRPVALDEVVQGMERMLARTLGEDIEIVARYGAGDALVLGDAGQLEQIVLNLVMNARDAMPDGGALVLETAEVGDTLRLSVTDTGCGMDAATQARVFEPFFTTKAQGKGTGLGLATVYGIVTQGGGKIGVVSSPERGTTFDVTLPAHRLPPARAVATDVREGSAPRGQGETVLLVEDEPALRAAVVRMLTRQGYQVVAAAHGGEALARWRELGGPAGEVPLVLSDVTMPVMGGGELVAALLAERPAQRVLLMTGYTDRPLPAEALARGVVVLEKPFSAPDLARVVRGALDPAATAPEHPSTPERSATA